MKFGVAGLVLSLASSAVAHSLGVNHFERRRLSQDVHDPASDDVDPSILYPAYNFTTSVDHFHNESMYEPHSNGKFNVRYWFDASNYKPGGPVIVLMGGETSGDDRLVYLQKGILAQMAKATNGVGVVLEHRYYGSSFPTPDLSTENLRFLTTDQSLADSVDFAENVKFKGLENYNLNAPHTPWIAYGGSYAGAYVAILRKLYPDTYWGAISSSGVTVAQWNFWQYYEAARIYGPKECVKATQLLTNAMDNIFMKNKKYGPTLKKAFGLEAFTYDDDFMNFLSNYGIAGLQGLNWDPAVSSEAFYWYCGNVSSTTIEFSETKSLQPTVEKLLDAGGYGKQKKDLTPRMLNWIGYNNITNIGDTSGEELVQENTQHNVTFYEQHSLDDATWRSWSYQYCTQWGYIQSSTGVPKTQLPLISKLSTLKYQTEVCRSAFGLDQPANTQAINKYGNFKLFYDRLAHIGGERDPWRYVTPLADSQPKRPNTIDEPFFEIKNGVHHWDENGVFANQTTATFPPQPVKDAQAQIRNFVKAWVQEWHQTHYKVHYRPRPFM
ncbi:MAG: hypothetical protein MMC23_007858 [Stictis urceolatum]|nr:hypothetical protein [Stictis urceolata]